MIAPEAIPLLKAFLCLLVSCSAAWLLHKAMNTERLIAAIGLVMFAVGITSIFLVTHGATRLLLDIAQ